MKYNSFIYNIVTLEPLVISAGSKYYIQRLKYKITVMDHVFTYRANIHWFLHFLWLVYSD